MQVLPGWPRWAAGCALATGLALAEPPLPSGPDAAPVPSGQDTGADAARPGESAPPVETSPDASPPDAPPPDAAPPSAASGPDASGPGGAEAPLGEPSPGEADQTEPPTSEADARTEVPAPPEPTRTELEAPPPNPSLVPQAEPMPPPAPSKGPFGWSARTTRTVGWITFAVAATAGAGLTAAGIAACGGQDLGCIQGQPLIWSGAVVGLSGIPIGLTLVVRGGRLSLGTQAAASPVSSPALGWTTAAGASSRAAPSAF